MSSSNRCMGRLLTGQGTVAKGEPDLYVAEKKVLANILKK